MLTIDSVLAQMESARRTADWFGPERRSYHLDFTRGPDKSALAVIESPHLAQTEIVKRSWRERLFSRPWRPLRKFKVALTGKPAIYHDGRGTIYACPLGYDAIRKAEYLAAKDAEYLTGLGIVP